MSIIELTDDYGRPLCERPAGGWIIEAHWAGRDDCPAQEWWAASELEAEEFLRSLQDVNHLDSGRCCCAEYRTKEGHLVVDITLCGCVESMGVVRQGA